jgi:heterodisulfide reductase subunit A
METCREELRIGVFVCLCGGDISKTLNVKVLKQHALQLQNVTVAELHPSLCLEDGQQLIREAIVRHGLDRVVVVGCSRKVYESTFRQCLQEAGLNAYLLEIVNIREHCAWVHLEDKPGATEKAKQLIAAGVEAVKASQPVETREFPMEESALVLGGGIAGMEAALDLADQGFNVYLVERSPSLGGNMAKLDKTFPTNDCAICIEGPKMAEVTRNPNIQLLTYSEIQKISGTVGQFNVEIVKKPRYVDVSKCTACGTCAEKCPVKVSSEWDEWMGLRKAIYVPFSQALPRKYVMDSDNCLYFQKGVCRICEKFCPSKAIDFSQKPETIQLKVGTVIFATGFQEYKPKELQKYGYGKYKNVITQLELARLLDSTGPTGGKLLRQSDGKKPKKIVMLQCVGSREEETHPYCSRYCCMAAVKNALLVKIEQDPDIEVWICYKDLRAAGKGFEEYCGRVEKNYGVNLLRAEVAGVKENEKTKSLTVSLREVEAKGPTKLESDLVVLSTAIIPSQGVAELAEKAGVEIGRDGFVEELDAKSRLTETNIDGIFACGCATGPKDIPESVVDAAAAAMKAGERMRMGRARRDLTIAVIDGERCGNCGICRDVCPSHAIEITEQGPIVNELLCKGCGICIGACPANVIDLNQWSSTKLLAEVKAILSHQKLREDDHLDSKPLLVFACDECAYATVDAAGIKRMQYPSNVYVIRVPCVGIVSLGLLLETLQLGVEGILLLGCLKDRCQYLEGGYMTERKLTMFRQILREFGVDASRIGVEYASAESPEAFVNAVKRMSTLSVIQYCKVGVK